MTDKIKSILNYVGLISAIVAGIAYIAFTVVLVQGFKQSMDAEKQLFFSIVSAVIGTVIMLLLREQGIAFAREIEDNKVIMTEYYQTINKTKKTKQLRSIEYFRVKSIIIDLFSKTVTVALTTFGMLYIFMEGNGDWGLIGLAISNLLMFSGFGLLSINKAYDYYNEQHIPVIKERTIRLKEDQVGSVQPEEVKNDKVQQHRLLDFTPTSRKE